VSVVFGEDSNITNLGFGAFKQCFALTSITLPGKLEVIEEKAFSHCPALERVICNKNLKTIGEKAFLSCSKLEDFQLASSSTSFGKYPFVNCKTLIEIATAAGFPSNTFSPHPGFAHVNLGDGVVHYLIDRIEAKERRRYVLLAHVRFESAVHANSGTKEEKVAAASKQFVSGDNLRVLELFKCCHDGGGARGVLPHILRWL